MIREFNVMICEKRYGESNVKWECDAVPDGQADDESFPFDSPWMILLHNPSLLAPSIIRLLEHLLLLLDIIARIELEILLKRYRILTRWLFLDKSLSKLFNDFLGDRTRITWLRSNAFHDIGLTAHCAICSW